MTIPSTPSTGMACPVCGTPVLDIEYVPGRAFVANVGPDGEPLTPRLPGEQATELILETPDNAAAMEAAGLSRVAAPQYDRLVLKPCEHRIRPADHPELTAVWRRRSEGSDER